MSKAIGPPMALQQQLSHKLFQLIVWSYLYTVYVPLYPLVLAGPDSSWVQQQPEERR